MNSGSSNSVTIRFFFFFCLFAFCFRHQELLIFCNIYYGIADLLGHTRVFLARESFFCASPLDWINMKIPAEGIFRISHLLIAKWNYVNRVLFRFIDFRHIVVIRLLFFFYFPLVSTERKKFSSLFVFDQSTQTALCAQLFLHFFPIINLLFFSLFSFRFFFRILNVWILILVSIHLH